MNRRTDIQADGIAELDGELEILRQFEALDGNPLHRAQADPGDREGLFCSRHA